jgi:hypothetical protein
MVIYPLYRRYGRCTGRKAGNPGFTGYQYQIEATIWVALDLMLATRATEIQIESQQPRHTSFVVRSSEFGWVVVRSAGTFCDGLGRAAPAKRHLVEERR